MDSPRTLLIYELLLKMSAAFELETYSVDPETTLPRVANLGHLIEKIAAFIGYRPKPDGTIDTQTEKNTFGRGTIAADQAFPTGDYLAGRFGSKGLLMRRLPNKKTGGKFEPGGMVKIHDLPQLLSETLDQLNTALNLQDSTSIQIKDGETTHSYPNQLALMMEIGTGMIQQRRQVREIWTSSIVTQKTVNEVIAGIGLPTVSKSLVVNGQQIPYWGIQPDKSLQREIATVAFGVGMVKGQLL